MFKMPSRSTLENLASDLLKKFYDHEEEQEEEVFEQVNEVSTSSAKTYAQSLQEDIDSELTPKSYDNT